MIKKIFFFLLLIFAFKGCTRDDICPEGVATTPNLIITFNNFTNPANRKTVEGLSIETDYENPLLVLATTDTDSIVIPLSTTSDTTKYQFIRTTISPTDTIVNIDRMMFIYQRNNIYVNRACGYKAEFNNLIPDLEEEGADNWIKNVLTIRDTVNDETSAHVTILH